MIRLWPLDTVTRRLGEMKRLLETQEKSNEDPEPRDA